MKSGLRGGKPRDMATFKKGGTSRGAGAAKKGFDYAIYKKGGKVKKYEEGGGVETRSYASFGDWMGDLFGKKKEAPKVNETKAIPDEDTGKNMAMRRVADVPVMQGVEPPAPSRSARPSRTAPQRRMDARRRQDRETMARDVAESGGRDFPQLVRESRARDASAMNQGADPALDRETVARYRQEMGVGDDPILAREAAARRRQAASGLYAKGGGVKMAGGGSCRGMGAAQRGGKYTIK